MKLKDIERRLVPWFKSGKCVYLRGPIGRGKTTVIQSAPARLNEALKGNYGIVIVSGPLLNPPDAVGYLMPEKRGEWLMSLFTQPFWFITDEGKHISEYDGGIILVDEADKMDTDVKKVIGEAALSGRLGPHRLAEHGDWRVWMAGNRAGDRSGATKEFDHLINRRFEINVDDDLQSTEDYYMAKGVRPEFIAFAHSNAQVVFMDPPPVPGPWCTPRSLHSLAEYAEQHVDSDGMIPTDPLFKEEAAGFIGEGATAQLFATLELAREMPRFEDIVANPGKVKLPTKADAQMLVVYTLAAKVDEQTLGPCIKYIERMPAEFTITFGKCVVTRKKAFVVHPDFAAWCQRNSALLMAITSIA
jgi:hypothetical protein